VPVWEACFNPMSISFGLVALAEPAVQRRLISGRDARATASHMVDYFGGVPCRHFRVDCHGCAGLVAIGSRAPRLLGSMMVPGHAFALATIVMTPLVGFLLWRGRFVWYRVLTSGPSVHLSWPGAWRKRHSCFQAP